MKKAFLALVLVGCLVSMCQAAAPKYSVGMEIDGAQVIHFVYNACPLDTDNTFEKIRKGGLDKATLDSLNMGEEFGKVATLETKKELTIGDLPVPAGKYTAGFNADEKGTFYFVVWMGGEAKKTKLEIKDHENVTIPNLTFMFGPSKEGSDLVALYGKSYSLIPVKIGAAAAPAKVEEKKADAKEEKKGDNAGEDEESWDDLNTHSFSGR